MTTRNDTPIVVIDGKDIERAVRTGRPAPLTFRCSDGNVFSSLEQTISDSGRVKGIALPQAFSWWRSIVAMLGTRVCVYVQPVFSGTGHACRITVERTEYAVTAYVRMGLRCVQAELHVIPVREQLHSRTRGLIETGVLAGKTVLIKALGSVGSTVTRLLAQSGVERFIMVDFDRVSVSNVVRHEAGISHVGRLKTDVLAELIHEKNPYAVVEKHSIKLCSETMGAVRQLVERSTLCIDTGDQREGKLLMNRLCLDAGKPLIISGAFRRAHGGQVFRVRPGTSACYACFVKMLANDSGDHPEPESEPVAYSDRPVPIEPGLSIDIDPICHMTAKVALQELMRGIPTTLRSLDQDLEADWFLYLNRREKDTQYEHMDPLGFGMDGMRILRWYGIGFDRDTECPVCGSFAKSLAELSGVTTTNGEVAEFMQKYAPAGVINA